MKMMMTNVQRLVEMRNWENLVSKYEESDKDKDCEDYDEVEEGGKAGWRSRELGQ